MNQCKKCGKSIKSWKVYCNRACYWAISPKFQTNCKQCGKEFTTYPSFQKAGEGFLCGLACKHRWISQNYRGEKSKAGFKDASVKRQCKQCKKTFYAYKNKVDNHRAVFCTKVCYSVWYREYIKVPENTPNYINGQGAAPYPAGFRAKRRHILARDDYTCQYCGTSEKLSVHHINYNKQDSSDTNLITACITCNIKQNSKVNRAKVGL